MTIWTLSVLGAQRSRRIVGTSPTATGARADALRAIGSLNAATGFEHPRYDVTVDGHVAAILQTGIDRIGLPDHRGIADLLQHLENATDPFPPF
jgi:hypothetical protein